MIDYDLDPNYILIATEDENAGELLQAFLEKGGYQASYPTFAEAKELLARDAGWSDLVIVVGEQNDDVVKSLIQAANDTGLPWLLLRPDIPYKLVQMGNRLLEEIAEALATAAEEETEESSHRHGIGIAGGPYMTEALREAGAPIREEVEDGR